MPIFEWGSIWKEAKSQKYLARSAEQQKRQTVIDLTRDVAETRDWIKTYRKLQTANVRVVKDAVDVARLSFDSYKAGRIIFLDVQRANVKELSAKVDAARNDGNLAIQIARLLALAEDIGDLNE
jgi:outer membrane protein TolC